MNSARSEWRHPPRQPVATAALRTTVRILVKPFMAPAVPVSVRRAGLLLASRASLSARGSRFTEEILHGVPCEKVTCGAAERSVLFFHGGAYCVGSPATHRGLTSHLAKRCRADVHVVDYRLAPEHVFPAAVDDCLNAYRGLLEEVPESRIVFAGDSAGGGLVLATALAAHAEGLPLPAGLVMFSPWVDLTCANAQQPAPREYMLSWPGLQHAAELYANDERNHPLASPLFGDLAGLPPMLIQVGSEEILLAEAEQLFIRARDAGVAVTLKVSRGLWHVFQAHAGMLRGADQALDEVADFLDITIA